MKALIFACLGLILLASSALAQSGLTSPQVSPPIGPASGGLSGNYPGPSVVPPTFGGDCTNTPGTYLLACIDPSEPAPHPGYVVGNYYMPLGQVANAAAAAAIPANTITCGYGGVLRKLTVDTLSARVSVGSAGNVQIALYTSVSGRPGLLIGKIGSLSTATPGTITGAVTPNVQLGPQGANGGQDLWWCLNTDTGTPTYVVNNVSNPNRIYVGTANSTTIFSGNSVVEGVSCAGSSCQGASSTFGSWPSDLTTSAWADITAASYPMVSFHVFSTP